MIIFCLFGLLSLTSGHPSLQGSVPEGLLEFFLEHSLEYKTKQLLSWHLQVKHKVVVSFFSNASMKSNCIDKRQIISTTDLKIQSVNNHTLITNCLWQKNVECFPLWHDTTYCMMNAFCHIYNSRWNTLISFPEPYCLIHTAVSRKVVLQMVKSLSDSVGELLRVMVALIYGCLSQPWGVSTRWKETAQTHIIRSFLVIVAELPQTSIKQSQTLTTITPINIVA